MSIMMMYLSHTFEKLKPNILLILGDRYEIFAAASTAMAMNIPIVHISGGEVTEGAIDEQIRHAITKIAHIHFTYHPLTHETNILPYQMQNLIDALSQINKTMIITYPNSDNGGDYIIDQIKKF